METYIFKDTKLFSLCKSFFKKAMDILQQYVNKGGEFPKRTFYEPVPDFDEQGNIKNFSYVPYEDEDFSYLIFKCHELIKGLQETKNICNYILDKKYLEIGGTNYSPHTFLDEAIKDYLRRNKSISYQDNEFLVTYEKMENLIFVNEITFRTSAKIENFSCNSDVIEFDNTHFIKKYTREECKQLYHHPAINIYNHNLPHPGDFRIEVIKSKDKENWGKAGGDSIEEIKLILSTLRLFRNSTVGISTLEFGEPISWFPFTSKAQTLLPPCTVGDLCSIERSEVGDLIKLWKTISQANYKNCPALEIAIKRFNYAHEHRKREDSLIDIVIGLEALFLKERDELTFRMALRVSAFLEALLPQYMNQRENIFNNMTKAYGLRSSIVHGSHVPESKIWECKIVKTYLSDSIKLYAQLSQEHNFKQILKEIDDSIKTGSNKKLKALTAVQDS